jgi:hypothetical protein
MTGFTKRRRVKVSSSWDGVNRWIHEIKNLCRRLRRSLHLVFCIRCLLYAGLFLFYLSFCLIGESGAQISVQHCEVSPLASNAVLSTVQLLYPCSLDLHTQNIAFFIHLSFSKSIGLICFKNDKTDHMMRDDGCRQREQ